MRKTQVKNIQKIAWLQLPIMIFAVIVTGIYYRGIRTSADSLDDIFKSETFQGPLWWFTIIAWVVILFLSIVQTYFSTKKNENSKNGLIAGITGILTIIPLAGALATLVSFIYNVKLLREID